MYLFAQYKLICEILAQYCTVYPTPPLFSLKGIVLVYDVTNEQTFRNVSKWIRNIKEVSGLCLRWSNYVLTLKSFECVHCHRRVFVCRRCSVECVGVSESGARGKQGGLN